MDAPNAQQLLQIMWRRRLWVVFPVVLGVAAGLIAGRLIPPKYRSTAEILIEPPKVAAGLVKEITSMTVEERLDAVRKHITARERIEGLVRDLELYPELTGSGQLDAAVREMRSELKVRVGTDKMIRIELAGRDPRAVADAVNRLAADYVRQNSEIRGSESEGTIEFMQDQLDESKRTLEEHEERVSRFKAENLMRLPEQRGPHTRALEALEAKRAANRDTASSAEMRLALLRQGIRPVEQQGRALSPTAALLEQRRQELRELQRTFTEQHPDIIRLRLEVAALEREVAEAPQETAQPDQPVVIDPILAAEIAQLEFQIDDLKVEDRQIQAEIQRYRNYLAQIPAVEQQLQILTREADNLRGFYQRNLKRRTEIGVAEDLEKGDLRETMSIIDRATPASGPFSPNKPFLLIAGFAAGVFLGLGMALAREHLEGGFESPDDLRRAFPGVPVLNPIPRIRPIRMQSDSEAADERRSA